MRPRQILVRISTELSELLRILCMQLVLAPAAYCLPRSWALKIAKAVSLSLIVLPVPGMTSYRGMRRAFGQNRYHSFLLTWGWLARPFLDFVILKRVLYGREDVAHWRIVERNAETVARLREAGRSFIVATGHFQRVAFQATACPCVSPGALVQVGHPPPQKIQSLFDLRILLQYGTMLKAVSSVWHRPFEFAFTGHGRSAATLLFDRLRKPGHVVNIHVDAPWPNSSTGSFCRPFAGFRSRSFSTGAVQLAQLTRCPIVSCIYWQEDDGTIVLKWGSVIENVDDEIDTMNRLIDPLEDAVGERPTQYVLDIGRERRWNHALMVWEDYSE